ncbi:hypothetical protein FIBSPDRAFT_889356 [Athelia psychrophila]|uniref:Uncharacterized protein n=1 Tax=Athelia psychrophila TaxID=1759441 RepID=A0A166MBP3_9AGAM|nr:hypothetical protein FIBSPDRAFT_889356 [Fibularhizoctonia sp. CBS 109695]
MPAIHPAGGKAMSHANESAKGTQISEAALNTQTVANFVFLQEHDIPCRRLKPVIGSKHTGTDLLPLYSFIDFRARLLEPYRPADVNHSLLEYITVTRPVGDSIYYNDSYPDRDTSRVSSGRGVLPFDYVASLGTPSSWKAFGSTTRPEVPSQVSILLSRWGPAWVVDLDHASSKTPHKSPRTCFNQLSDNDQTTGTVERAARGGGREGTMCKDLYTGNNPETVAAYDVKGVQGTNDEPHYEDLGRTEQSFDAPRTTDVTIVSGACFTVRTG